MVTQAEYDRMYELVGVAMEVYNEMGRGLEEALYQEAMEIEMSERGIPFEREKVLHAYYKGREMKKKYIADFYSQGVIIEFKSASSITQDHRAQLFNYLRLTKLKMGLLVNFGEDHFHAERYIYNNINDKFELITKSNVALFVARSGNQ